MVGIVFIFIRNFLLYGKINSNKTYELFLNKCINIVGVGRRVFYSEQVETDVRCSQLE